MAGLRAEGQERAVGGAAFRAQGGEDDLLHLVVILQHAEQRLVEFAGGIAFGRALEFVVETELVQEGAKACVVVVAEAFMRAERVGHAGQRLVEMLGQHFLVRHVVRHLAQAVHIVGKGEQPGRDIRHGGKGVAHHGGARDLAEGADMRQAGRAIAGLEQHITLVRRRAPGARHQLARLLEGPGLRLQGKIAVVGHGSMPFR
jgi:hypothetical protein